MGTDLSRFVRWRASPRQTSQRISALGRPSSLASRKKTSPYRSSLAHEAAAEFDLPVEFFTVARDVAEVGTPTFRKTSKATVRAELKVVRAFHEAARLFRMASERSGYRAADIYQTVSDDVEETAANLRSMLGIAPGDPLPNATRAAERLGVGVIHELLPEVDEDGDHHGISCPSTSVDRPLVATVGAQPPAVARLTVMHEPDMSSSTVILGPRYEAPATPVKYGPIALPERCSSRPQW